MWDLSCVICARKKTYPCARSPTHTELPILTTFEKIEIAGDFDRLPAGSCGLDSFALWDAFSVDSNVVAANYKRETSGEVPLEPFGLEPESRTLYSPVSRVNRFSSVATFAFVLIFLLAGGGILWFMKGRTDQLVPIGSIVDRIKTVVDPVVEKLPQLNNVNEKAKNVDERRRTDVARRGFLEAGASCVVSRNLKMPVALSKGRKTLSAQRRSSDFSQVVRCPQNIGGCTLCPRPGEPNRSWPKENHAVQAQEVHRV